VTVSTLLAELDQAGIVLHVEAGRLAYRAPAGALTPELREQVAAHKAALLELLAPSTADLAQLTAATSRQDALHGPRADAVGRMDVADSPPVEQQNNDAGALPLPDHCPTLTDVVPDEALPLWLYDALYPPGPGESPAIPPPAELTAAQLAAAILTARVTRPDPIVASPPGGTARPVGSAPEATPHRRPPRPRPAERDQAAMARILDRGEALGYPSLPYRPGESIAAGGDGWRRFVERAPPSRLADALRLLDRQQHAEANRAE